MMCMCRQQATATAHGRFEAGALWQVQKAPPPPAPPPSSTHREI